MMSSRALARTCTYMWSRVLQVLRFKLDYYQQMKTEAENKNIFNSFEEKAFYNALEKIKFVRETAL